MIKKYPDELHSSQREVITAREGETEVASKK
jgi:hypothetical protein